MSTLRDQMAYEIAKVIYRRDDPSPVLVEVCLPYADAVMNLVMPVWQLAMDNGDVIVQLRGDLARTADALALAKAKIPTGSPHRLRDRLRLENERLRAQLAEAEEAMPLYAADAEHERKRAEQAKATIAIAHKALKHADQYCPDLENHGSDMADQCETCGQAAAVRSALAAIAALDQPEDQ